MAAERRRRIGILGGVGPQAGVALMEMIIAQTPAKRDQDHFDCTLLSMPSVPDRTAYLLGESTTNPAEALLEGLQRLSRAGAEVCGIACNTAHAEPILGPLRAAIVEEDLPIELVDMLEEVGRHLAAQAVHEVGVLATLGTHHVALYPRRLRAQGITVRSGTAEQQQAVHQAIYDPDWGIKARSALTSRAKPIIQGAARALDAPIVVLGCTELPLGLPDLETDGITFLDPGALLARALIERASR